MKSVLKSTTALVVFMSVMALATGAAEARSHTRAAHASHSHATHAQSAKHASRHANAKALTEITVVGDPSDGDGTDVSGTGDDCTGVADAEDDNGDLQGSDDGTDAADVEDTQSDDSDD